VAARILRRITHGDRRVQHAAVKVRKLSPPINGDVAEVAVCIES
jgi:dihydroneopterin aldolase